MFQAVTSVCLVRICSCKIPKYITNLAILLSGTKCVYCGQALEVTLTELSPSETLSLKVRASVPGDDSPFSEVRISGHDLFLT